MPGPNSHTHPISEVTLLQSELERIARDGLPEKFWPALTGYRFYKTQALLLAASAGHMARFVPIRTMTVRGLSFITTIASTANDECAVVMRDETAKTNLATSGAVASKLNATAGRQDVDFTADVTLTAGKVYYPGFQYNTVGGTAATVLSSEMQSAAGVAGFVGATPPNPFILQATPTFPWSTEGAPSAATNRLILIVRER